jgi:phosphatidylinositol alpha-mannosyltransferase
MPNPSRSLKVGFILDGGLEQPDGVQQYILALGDWFKSQGHEVRYLVSGDIAEGLSDAASLSRSLHVTSNGNRLSIPLPAKRSRLRTFMKTEKFDVLHVQTPYSPLMGERLIMLADDSTAIIGTFHILPYAWYFGVGNYLLGLWCRRSLKHFDKMLSVSSAAQTFAKRTFKISSEVLPNVIDYDRFHKAKARAEYRGDGKLTILYLGRLVPRKGCQMLLEAISLLVGRGAKPEFRVVICGSGPLEAKLKRYVSDHELESIVEFKGFISEADKPSYYASADLAVFPSKGGESFGIVLLEAMASGQAAVLAGNNPGYASVLKDQHDLLFDPNDPASLSNKLERYLSQPELRRQMASWGEVYARDFDVGVIGAKLLNIYSQALLKRRSK